MAYGKESLVTVHRLPAGNNPDLSVDFHNVLSPPIEKSLHTYLLKHFREHLRSGYDSVVGSETRPTRHALGTLLVGWANKVAGEEETPCRTVANEYTDH